MENRVEMIKYSNNKDLLSNNNFIYELFIFGQMSLGQVYSGKSIQGNVFGQVSANAVQYILYTYKMKHNETDLYNLNNLFTC